MQQYFIPTLVEKTLTLNDADTVHHITRVMRMDKGAIIALCGHDNACYAARIDAVTMHSVSLTRLYPLKSINHPVSITLALALIRKPPFELALQKAVELGVEGFIPLECERSVVRIKAGDKAKKASRYEKIAKEAAEQSRRPSVPEIHPYTTLSDLDLSAYDYVFVPYEQETAQPAKAAFQFLRKGLKILIIIGPEGGFSDPEIERLTGLGAQTLSLGPRILRTETAVFYTLSAINYETETESSQ